MPRPLRVVLAVVVAAVALSACLPATTAENGRLADSSLTTISPSCRVVNEIAPDLQQMIADANAAGYKLQPETKSYSLVEPPTLESCYRSYDGQVWWRRYYCSTGHCELAATPGTSKHGLGRAVDFQDQNGELAFTSPGYAWLTKNAARFGFVQPVAMQQGGASAEAWHWEVQ